LRIIISANWFTIKGNIVSGIYSKIVTFDGSTRGVVPERVSVNAGHQDVFKKRYMISIQYQAENTSFPKNSEFSITSKASS
jgi:hypothetical protein